MDNQWLTTEDIARHFGVTTVTVTQWIKSGLVPGAQKIGRDWLIPPESLPLINPPKAGRPKEDD